jgi:hypothetical protein
LLLTTVNGQRHEWWREGWPDLRWNTVGKGAGQHSLQTQVELLDADPPSETRPHLNSVDQGVKVGGTRTNGSRGVGGATATVAVIAIVVVILLLVGLLQLLLLRALLVLLLSWRAFLSTGKGRG